MSQTYIDDTVSQQEIASHAPIDFIACCMYAQALEKDLLHPPAYKPEFGELNEIIEDILEDVELGVPERHIREKINNYKDKVPAFAALFAQPGQATQPKLGIVRSEVVVPPLPDGIQFPAEFSKYACCWHNEYVATSKRWSPRSFANSHPASGWSMLSGVALRRVVLHLGSPKYTPLTIGCIASTTLNAKTEQAKVYESVLRKAGFDWLMAPDSMTPQAMVGDMDITTAIVPADYDKLSEEEQAKIKRSFAFKGQHLWFYEEFGQHMDAMMQKSGGPMAEFKGLIRRLDDCWPEYRRLTIAHKNQRIEAPYLSLMACMTPFDLRPYAGIDSPLWRDGFFARFAFIVPDEKARNRDRFPSGNLYEAIPRELYEPLQQWDKKLGQRDVDIRWEYDEKKKENKYTVVYGDFPEQPCTLGDGVIDAFYNYNGALLDIIERERLEQFAGNYGRLHTIALRVAMLCASLENNGRIELQHWAKGQEFAEMARSGLHALWIQLQENSFAQEQSKIEESVIQYLRDSDTWLTARLMAKNKFKNYTGRKLTDEVLDNLVSSGDIVNKRETGKKAIYYTVPGHEKKPLLGNSEDAKDTEVSL